MFHAEAQSTIATQRGKNVLPVNLSIIYPSSLEKTLRSTCKVRLCPLRTNLEPS